MTNSIKPVLALLAAIGALTGAAYGQQAAASGNPVATKPDVQSAGGGYAVDENGQPPTPISTVPLLYPRLTGTWAGTTPSPSLSEKFNQLLPKWLQFSGEFRERFEGYSGGSFKHDSTNDYDLQRIRLGMEIKPTSWVKFYIEMQDARVFGITPALPPYNDTMQPRQAYIQFGPSEGNGFSLQGGRMDITYGNNRLVGDSWWTNVSRSFDGVRAAYQQGRFRVDVFGASVVIMRQGVIDHQLAGNNLYGAYATAKNVIPHATLDLYEFWNLRPSFALVQEKAGHLDEWTTGFRWVGALPHSFDYRTEMAYQLGTLSVDKIRAWMGHWVMGYTAQQAPLRPRFFVEYDYGSGSGNTKDGYDNTFDPIYPSTHDKLGLADQFGWRNIRDLRFGQEYHIARKWTAATSIHDLWLANAHDALYPTRGSNIAQDVAGTDGTHVGVELDVQAIYTPTRQTQLDFGLGHVIPGEFLKKTTQGVAYTYPYMQMEYVF
ncbi:MAG: alginate export family protein [Bryobacteraceae bacterium]